MSVTTDTNDVHPGSAAPVSASTTNLTADSNEGHHSRKIRDLIGALAGSTFEVFDWSIYSTFAAFFATAFFADQNVAAFLGTNIVFAVGFIARPLGSLIFGHISDTRGRKISLFATSATALVGTLLIAFSPTQQTIGIGAAIILVTARIIQGLAHGGEQPAAGAYISEIAKPHNRGVWSSWVYVAIFAGGIFGTLLAAVLTSLLGAPALIAGGWRIAFVIGALGSAYSLYLIRRLDETEVFEGSREVTRGTSLVREMVRAWRPSLMIIGLTIGTTVAFQNWIAIPSYHIVVFGTSPDDVLWTALGMQLIAILALPLWGLASDRIGRKPVVLIGFIGAALTTFPFMNLLDGSTVRMFLTGAVSLVLLVAPLAILPALMAELVPTSIRTIGVGFSYAVATGIFGGTVLPLQTWIGDTWGPQYFGIYVTITLVVSVVVALLIPETRGKDLRAVATTESTVEK